MDRPNLYVEISSSAEVKFASRSSNTTYCADKSATNTGCPGNADVWAGNDNLAGSSDAELPELEAGTMQDFFLGIELWVGGVGIFSGNPVSYCRTKPELQESNSDHTNVDEKEFRSADVLSNRDDVQAAAKQHSAYVCGSSVMHMARYGMMQWFVRGLVRCRDELAWVRQFRTDACDRRHLWRTYGAYEFRRTLG